MPAEERPAARQIRRLREIATVLVRFGFADVATRLRLQPQRRWWRIFHPPRSTPPSQRLLRIQRFRQVLEELGPTFVKFGQAVSTRADVLPEDLVAELSRLQDTVPPLTPGVAEEAIERDLGVPLESIFASFDAVPVAAGSIAQVHRARLHSGEEVAVKVRRPGIGAVIESDLAILGQLARLAERYLPDSELSRPSDLVAEFAKAVRREQNLVREGRTIARFAENFSGDATVYVPRVHWAYTREGVLVLDYVNGARLSDVLKGTDCQFDRKLIARRGADAVLKQVLLDGFFHADPHPGNVFVMPGHVLCFLDFGVVGRLDTRLKRKFFSLVAAITRGDPGRLASAVVEIADVRNRVYPHELEGDLGDLLEGYANLPLAQLSVGPLLRDVFGTIARHRIRFPPDLMLLAKAVITMEGVGRQLDPSFNLLEHARPFVERLLRDRLAPAAVAGRAAELAQEAVDIVRTVPQDLAEVVAKARNDSLQIQFVHRNLEQAFQEIDRASNRLGFAVVIAALIVGSSLLMQAGVGPPLAGYSVLGLAGFMIAAVMGLWLTIGIMRSGRL
ncbi:MAG: ABC1 kinase family protein [Vicinamibacterales bacterium]